jgi:hypothetical protein
LSELPDRARQRLQTPADEWRAQIEQRIRAFDQNDKDNAVTVQPEPTTLEEREPAIQAPDASPVSSWRGAYIAMVIVSALAAASALLLSR